MAVERVGRLTKLMAYQCGAGLHHHDCELLAADRTELKRVALRCWVVSNLTVEGLEAGPGKGLMLPAQLLGLSA